MKYPKFLAIYSLILISVSCNKNCDDFNYDVIQWLPYKETEEILLQNSIFIDTLTIYSREITHTEEIPRLSMCICENMYSVGMSSDSFKIFIIFQDSRNFTDSYVVINDEILEFHRQLDICEINGKQYTDLIEYTDDLRTQSGRFNTITIAKSIGIIYIKGTREEWTLVNDSFKKITGNDIETIFLDC